jgi:hypothetical protein
MAVSYSLSLVSISDTRFSSPASGPRPPSPLPRKRLRFVAPALTFPSIDIPRFMIAPQQEDFEGQLQLHRQQITDDFQAAHATIDVISQEQKVPGRQAHAESPQVVREEVQIFQIAMNVTEDVTRGLQEYDSWLLFQKELAFLAQCQKIQSKLFAVQVIDVSRGMLKHGNNSLCQRRMIVIGRCTAAAMELIKDTTGVDAGFPTEPFGFLCQQDTLLECLFLHGNGMGLQLIANFRGSGSGIVVFAGL